MARPRLRVAIIFLCGALLSGLAASASAGAQDGDRLGAEDGPSELLAEGWEFEYWKIFRSRFGYEMSDRALRALAVSEQGQRTIDEFSAPLTAVEERDMLRHFAIDEVAAELEAELSRVERYAGIYIDHSKGRGTIHLLHAGDMSRRDVEAISSRVRGVGDLEVRTVEHSLVELRDAAANLLQEGKIEGGQIEGIYVDVRRNAVMAEVLMDGRRSGDPEQLVLTTDSGVEIVLTVVGVDTKTATSDLSERTHCSSHSHCGGSAAHDLRGGLTIFDDGANNTQTPTGFCTTGFMVESNPPGPITQGVLTAGHCAILGNSPDPTPEIASHSHHQYFGTNSFAQAQVGIQVSSDAVQLNVPSGRESHHIWKNNSQRFRPINKVILSHSQGALACISSWRFGSNFICGEIAVGSLTYTLGETDMAEMWIELPVGLTDCKSVVGGASGAPIFRNRNALGIQSGCGVDPNRQPTSVPGGTRFYIVYSKAHNVETDLNVSIRTS